MSKVMKTTIFFLLTTNVHSEKLHRSYESFYEGYSNNNTKRNNSVSQPFFFGVPMGKRFAYPSQKYIGNIQWPDIVACTMTYSRAPLGIRVPQVKNLCFDFLLSRFQWWFCYRKLELKEKRNNSVPNYKRRRLELHRKRYYSARRLIGSRIIESLL